MSEIEDLIDDELTQVNRKEFDEYDFLYYVEKKNLIKAISKLVRECVPTADKGIGIDIVESAENYAKYRYRKRVLANLREKGIG